MTDERRNDRQEPALRRDASSTSVPARDALPRDALPRDAVGRGLGKRAAAAYQGALEAIFAIVITMLAGWWIDRHFGTEPAFVLVGAAVGFAAFVVRVWRLRDLMVPEVVDESGKPDGNGSGST